MKKILLDLYVKFKKKKPIEWVKLILGSTFAGIVLYFVTIILGICIFSLKGILKLYFSFVLIFYIPFAICDFFNKKEGRKKILFPACYINILLCLLASIFEIIDLGTVQLGFKLIMIGSILNLLLIYYINEYVGKKLIKNITNFGFVIILFITGILLLI